MKSMARWGVIYLLVAREKRMQPSCMAAVGQVRPISYFIPSRAFPRYEHHLISMQEDAGRRGLHKTPEFMFLSYLETHRWLKLF
jgi:hypothetical protein